MKTWEKTEGDPDHHEPEDEGDNANGIILRLVYSLRIGAGTNNYLQELR
jgi:hypothetical protein